MRLLGRLVVGAALLCPAARPVAAQTAGPWPMFRATAAHAGASALPGPSSIAFAWSHPTNDAIVFSSPAVASGGPCKFRCDAVLPACRCRHNEGM